MTSLLVYRYLQTVKAANEQQRAQIVFTTQDIPSKTIIEPAMLTVREVRRGETPRGAYARMEAVVGKVALSNLSADTPVTDQDVEEKGASLGLSYVIPPSMRAVTVAVDPVIGVAGFLKPGDHVDVVATFNRGRGQMVAKTVLQDVTLLALGSQLEKERMKKEGGDKPTSLDRRDTATLLVTPAEAEKLVLAENEGKLRLVLRAAGDVLRVDSGGITTQTVTGRAPEAEQPQVTVRESSTRAEPVERRPAYSPPPPAHTPPPPARPQPKVAVDGKIQPKEAEKSPGYQIEVIRGTKVEKVTVNDADNTKKEDQ